MDVFFGPVKRYIAGNEIIKKQKLRFHRNSVPDAFRGCIMDTEPHFHSIDKMLVLFLVNDIILIIRYIYMKCKNAVCYEELVK